MSHVRVSAVIFILALLFAAPVFAQFGLPGVENTVSMTASPRYPEPGSNIHLKLKSPVIDLDASGIVWYQDGKRLATGIGDVDVDAKVGALGTKTVIEADISTQDGVLATSTITLVPTEVDMLFDSNSYVPPFYRGRALPSAGSDLHVQVIPRFKRSDGTFVPESDINFTWKRNDVILPDISGIGKSSATIPAPPLYGADAITVDAISIDKSFVGEARQFIPAAKPLLLLYEDHPLFGLLFHQAFAADTVSYDKELAINAIPYFAVVTRPDDPSLTYEWTVNDDPLQATSSIQNEIVLGASRAGVARVKILVTDLRNVFYDITGAWRIIFSDSHAPASTN